MSDYKKYMGYQKKIEKKEKTNELLENIKDEFGFSMNDLLNEVGASAEYRKYTQKIEKSYRKYWDEVKDFEDLLVKKGLKPAAKEIHKKYAKDVLGFQVWLRGKLERLL